MLVFLLIVLLLAVLGVLGLALKIAAALVLGFLIAVTAIVAGGYLFFRHQVRRATRAMDDPRRGATGAISGTTVEIGQPRRDPDRAPDPGIDDRY
jgi:hypothetical protein